ncbi:MAG TPA: four helix bundle protein [Phycisphaerales bacterium]|nr:four helix bundle protein [Phycisphaerales bacterium]
MTPNELKSRTNIFAHRCVKLALSLPDTPLSRHIQNQLIRCSTSVPANYRASCLAHSKAAFSSKISIVLEETDETAFWIEFLIEEGILPLTQCEALLNEAKELTAVFVASRKTAQTISNKQ